MAKTQTSSSGAAVFAFLYTLLIVYSAMVPFHYVPLDPAVAWQRLLTIPYVVHGSDQRSDWMGNLLMLIPLGYALAALLASGRSKWRLLGGLVAFLLCAAVILAVKYVQLFFPPRTVTINYVVAQSAGAAIGIVLRMLSRPLLERARAHTAAGGRGAVIALLWLYAAGLVVFLLLPFDFVLSRGDLADRFAALPGFFFALPGGQLGAVRRVLLLGALMVETAPLGMLWAMLYPRRRLGLILFALFCAAAMSVATLFVMSARPTAMGGALRALGIIAGAVVTARAIHWPVAHYTLWLRRALPLLAVAYLVVLIPASGIRLSGLHRGNLALDTIDPRVWLPFFLWYNTGKGVAAFAAIAHAVLYLPVGLLLWRRPWLAAITAAAICAAMEFGRILTGLQPDPNNLLIAAAIAGVTAHYAPIVWDWQIDHTAPAGRK